MSITTEKPAPKEASSASGSGSIVLQVFRGDANGGGEERFEVPAVEGMVVLDAVHYIQANYANDLACRWNCKAAKCGSCSAEINGHPRLMCKTRVDEFPDQEIHVWPMRTFPLIKDLVTDVSWNYEVNKQIPGFTPPADEPVPYRMLPEDTERIYEYRKCIECFLCQDVCHVLRNHDDKSLYYGPRYMVRIAALEMHPLDTQRRTGLLNGKAGVGMCNITKCCQEVCPEHIKITDNAIIPLKERMATDVYDPVAMVLRKLRPRRQPVAAGEADGATVVRLPQRFAVKDVVRLKTRGRPMARVGAVLPDGKLEVWVLKMKGTQQHWRGPKVVEAADVTNNYGPLDEVGIGSKLFEQYLTEEHSE
ncbi:MAG TPA: succinate dehydrogenase/fumarate reductase iron-sulfur subunit [Candidatus Acidoferrum sp.]|nr:succinate dehydrogenase/fumarate reductase iron-sulfur subunit [Candidatus Acidoferrum sp.]